MKIGLIGTGMLGNAVGLHLLDSDFKLVAYNRTKNRTDELASHGAEVVDSPKEVAEKSDFVITCVKDADAVKEVSFGENGIIHGIHSNLTIADMSTINPISSREISSEYKKNGIEMLDIPVMGGPNVAINGKLVLMASGDSKTFEKHKKILETIAHKVFYLGENGTAHTVKLTMNLQIAMLALSISEGITLARGASIDPKIFLDILNETYFKTGMSENKGYKMIQDEFTPTFTLENLKKDLKTINETARSYGISLPMTTSAEQVYQQALNKGFGDLDYTGILAYLKSSTNSENIQN
ncbi:MAG: NAD(P)-dependent oxidoreductase [Crenarchaeota archaeon]|nr:MAG: NAD(P)-dependent oxidoreductase [Thermoproteota archaeon]RDJ33856.1 MAG: NAD(P)-dependent oxidoreductase [Thermoproteota archaeon]RDJ37034.1 MAG: NAD(P)-dependent oxidoreductase [Thermoproteota archaeon]RDJ37431.1 MAG: NAD(P)-dependent oxidoreductase [Thermoproteota archaeon]